MTRSYICKQTYCEGKRLGEYTHNLNERQQRDGSLEEYGNIGPKYLFPILAVTKHIDRKECYQRQSERNGDIARYIGSSREYGNKTHYVAQQYKEEYGEQQRRITFVVLAYRRLDYVIHNHGYDILHKTHKPARSGICCTVTPVPAGSAHHYHAEQQAVYYHGQRYLGERQV